MFFFLLALTITAQTITVTPQQGLAAIEKARDQSRAARRPFQITLAPGNYFLPRPIQLSSEDAPGSVLTAQPGARLFGGIRLANWQPVTDPAILARLHPAAKAHILVATVSNLSNLAARGFGRDHIAAHSELFFNAQRMTLARFPNSGFTRIAAPADAAPEDDGHGRKIGRLPHGFQFSDDNPTRWRPDSNIWVHGYWSWDWADSYERIASLDPSTKTILTAPPHGLYGFRKDQRFYFLNVLEELDLPGEYYLDLRNSRIYFYPPSATTNAEIILSTIGEPLLEITNARDLTIRNLTLAYTRGHGAVITGGENVTLSRLTVHHTGNSGILVDGGRGHAIHHASIHHTGDSAVEMSGGDRFSLTTSRHSITDSDIHHMGEWVRTYNPAVKANGVGITIAHNHIHDAPHAGILLTGNDHLIEANNIHHLALETGDVGAVYIGRDYTERGTIIRHNYIHQLGGVGLGSMAVYLDDCASGITVTGNIFYQLKYGAFIGGGRDNVVENNVFVNANPAIHLDARGIDPRPVWQNMVYETMQPKLHFYRILEPPYSTRFPQIQSVLPYLGKPGGVPPEGNIIRRNIIHGTGLGIRDVAKPYARDVADNVTLDDPAFFTPATGAHRVSPNFPWQPIPVSTIGPRP